MLGAKAIDGTTPLMSAAANGHSEIVEFLLDSCADLEATNNKGLNVEEVAAFRGHHTLSAMLQKIILPQYQPA